MQAPHFGEIRPIGIALLILADHYVLKDQAQYVSRNASGGEWHLLALCSAGPAELSNV